MSDRTTQPRIIRCTAADIDALRAISMETFDETYRRMNTAETMALHLQEAFRVEKLAAELENPDSGFFFLMETDDVSGIPAGYMKLNVGAAQTEPEGADAMEIERIYLRGCVKGRGYGAALIAAAEAEARKTGMRRLWLGVWERNSDAIGFYRRLGFEKTGEHEFRVGDELQQDWVMSRAVSSEADRRVSNSTFRIRMAVSEDVPVILGFIRELARYEQLLDQVTATEPLLREWIFEKRRAEVLIGETDGVPVGFALFFHNFSTFLGKAGIYLEDLYVDPACRGNGYGKLFLKELARIAKERSCGRLEWWCLDWNRPSIDFYLSLDAEPMKEWTVYRLTGEALDRLAADSDASGTTRE